MDIQRRLLAYLKPCWKSALGGLLCASVSSLVTGAVSWFLKHTIDAMNGGDNRQLKLFCVLVVLLFVIKGLFGFGQSYLLSLTANSVAARLRSDIFAHLHHLSLSYFNRRRTGAIMSTLTNDVPVLQSAAMSLRDVISAPLTVLVCVAVLLHTNWRLTLISLACIPVMSLVISRISRRIRRISTALQGRLADLTNVIEESVAGTRIIKSFAAEDMVIARFEAQNQLTFKTVMRGILRSAQLRPLLEIIGALGVATVLLLGGTMVAQTNNYQQTRQSLIQQAGTAALVQQKSKFADPFPPNIQGNALIAYQQTRRTLIEAAGTRRLAPEWQAEVPPGGMTGGGLLQFIFLLNALAQAAGDIGGIASMRAQALAAGKRIFDETLDVEPDVQEKPDAILMPVLQGHVRFENVSFQYGPDLPVVLKDVDFEVRPGEVVALVGRSGSGKSTLVDLIPRFYDPTDGRILIDGVDVRDVNLDSLRRQIGIVPQETWLFAGTLRDNIAYGNPGASDDEVKSAACDANAWDFIEKKGEGLDTVVSERGVMLSGGERQRIAIARAILLHPRLLILDEATSSLDASSEALVQEALDRMMHNRTTIVIAHRLSTIINADRILAMKDGRIVEAGSHRELIAAGGYYARLYETQLRGFD